MYVQAPSRRNDTKLNFLRNKICLKGKINKKIKLNFFVLHFILNSTGVYPARNRAPEPAKAPPQGPALLGAAACALGLVLVVGLIASAMYVRARKQIRQDSLQ